ncbi:MAG: ECF-type sigma factor [Acidobacteriota bacterium]
MHKVRSAGTLPHFPSRSLLTVLVSANEIQDAKSIGRGAQWNPVHQTKKKTDTAPRTITHLLRSGAFIKLTEIIEGDLSRIAAARLQDERACLLEPAELVNEYFLRLVKSQQVEWRDRVQFFAYASRVMRQILVDLARQRMADRRERGLAPSTFSDRFLGPPQRTQPIDILALDFALRELTQRRPRQARVVEMRFIAGMTVEEVAHALGLAPTAVKKDWTLARVWLRGKLDVGSASPVLRRKETEGQ